MTPRVPIPHCDECSPDFKCWGDRYTHCRKLPAAEFAAQRDAKIARDQLPAVKADLAALFALADIVEESDDGNLFHPNRLGNSCRAIDAAKMNELLERLKAFATS